MRASRLHGEEWCSVSLVSTTSIPLGTASEASHLALESVLRTLEDFYIPEDGTEIFEVLLIQVPRIQLQRKPIFRDVRSYRVRPDTAAMTWKRGAFFIWVEICAQRAARTMARRATCDPEEYDNAATGRQP